MVPQQSSQEKQRPNDHKYNGGLSEPQIGERFTATQQSAQMCNMRGGGDEEDNIPDRPTKGKGKSKAKAFLSKLTGSKSPAKPLTDFVPGTLDLSTMAWLPCENETLIKRALLITSPGKPALKAKWVQQKDMLPAVTIRCDAKCSKGHIWLGVMVEYSVSGGVRGCHKWLTTSIHGFHS